MNTTRSLFSSYLRIRSLAASASSPELAQARSELEANLHDLSSDLQDLIDSVKAVEGDPFRYGLDIDEVGRRRKLVEEVGGEVEDMREEVKSLANGQKRAGPNASALPPPSAFDPDAPDGDDYEAFEQQRQVEIMQEQDEALDGVFKTVGNLRQQADDMGRELEEQQEMLEEVETLAERVGGKLQTGIKKVGWVIKKNEGRPSYVPLPRTQGLTPTQKQCPAAALLSSFSYSHYFWYWSSSYDISKNPNLGSLYLSGFHRTD